MTVIHQNLPFCPTAPWSRQGTPDWDEGGGDTSSLPPRNRRHNDDRRRVADEEETVLDAADTASVGSIDRGLGTSFSSFYVFFKTIVCLLTSIVRVEDLFFIGLCPATQPDYNVCVSVL